MENDLQQQAVEAYQNGDTEEAARLFAQYKAQQQQLVSPDVPVIQSPQQRIDTARQSVFKDPETMRNEDISAEQMSLQGLPLYKQDAYYNAKEDVRSSNPYPAPFVRNTEYIKRTIGHGKNKREVTDTDTSLSLAPYKSDSIRKNKYMLGAGYTTEMLRHGLANLGDYAIAGEAGINRLMPFHSDTANKKLTEMYDAALNRVDERDNNYEENLPYNQALQKEVGIPGFLGSFLPYIALGPNASEITTKIGKTVADTAQSAAEMAVEVPSTAASKSFEFLANKFGTEAFRKKVATEFTIPKAAAALKAANAVKAVAFDPRVGALDNILGSTLLGAGEGWLRPDMTAGVGALAGLMAGGTNAAIGPGLSRLDNPKINSVGPAYRETLSFLERGGYQPPLGMKYGNAKLQADMGKFRQSPETLDQVAAFDANNQIALNRIVAKNVLGMPKEAADKITTLSPEVMSDRLKVLKEQFDNIENNSVARFSKENMDNINNVVDELGRNQTPEGKRAYRLADSYRQAIQGYRETAMRFNPQSFSGKTNAPITLKLKSLIDDAPKVTRELDDGTTEVVKDYASTYATQINPIGKILQQAAKDGRLQPETLRTLDFHLSKLKSKADLSGDANLKQLYNGVADSLTPLKDHLVSIREPGTGKFQPATLEGQRLVKLRDELSGAIKDIKYRNGHQGVKSTYYAGALDDILTEINKATDAGGGPFDTNTVNNAKSQYAMYKVLEEHGLDMGGNVSKKRLYNFISNDKEGMLGDALRGVGLRGETEKNMFGTREDAKSTLQHIARLHEIDTKQKKPSVDSRGQASPDSILHSFTRTPASTMPKIKDIVQANRIMYGGYPLETGWLNLPYKGKGIDGRTRSGYLSSANLIHSLYQAQQANPNLSTIQYTSDLIDRMTRDKEDDKRPSKNRLVNQRQ
jgi:hypothetical protein